MTADVAAILEIHSNAAAIAHNPSDVIADEGAARNLFLRWNDHWQRCGFGYWVVRRRETLNPLGFCGVKVMPVAGSPSLNLFYRFAPAAWGQGIAGEAAVEVVRWARDTHPDLPVVARVRPENAASHRVATKAGLQRAEHLDGEGYDGLDLVYLLGSLAVAP